MYDLTICVLTSLSEKSRLNQFSEIGLKLSKKFKTKIVYLVENDEKPNFIKDTWEKIKGPVSCRFLSYLINHYEEDSRWILQVDDDSCTDIERTLEIIDSFYDNDDPVILMGSYVYIINNKFHLSYNMNECLQEALKKLNIKNMFLGTSNINEFEMMPRFKHSWEQSMISSSAAIKIKKSIKTKDFLDLCLELKPQYTDQVPYVAAKLAKIPTDECFIFCPFPMASEYTAINKNGRYTHIHHVLNFWDELENFKNILKNGIQFENKTDAKNALSNNKLPGTFWRAGDKILKFEASGLIGGDKGHDRFAWKQIENELIFFTESGKITCILKRINKDTFKGMCLQTQNTCILKKIDIISLIGMQELKNELS